MPQPFVVAIAGPSGAGKSYLAHHLAARFPERDPVVVSTDAYYQDLAQMTYEERCRVNFDAPDSIDDALLCEQIATLRRGDAVECPVYDFSRHTRADQAQRIAPGGLVILEGILALHWAELRSLFDLKVFVRTQDDVCLSRRLDRDIVERGRTEESVLRQYSETVRPMCERYVLPTAAHADLVLSGTAAIEANVDRIAAALPPLPALKYRTAFL